MSAASRSIVAALGLALAVTSALAQDAVTGGAVLVEPTFQHLGVLWRITGDADLDASCSIRFRRQGEAAWRQGLDLVRAHPGITGEGGTFPDNRFAGSLFFLEPGTTHDIELTLADPDGGSETRIVTGTTAREMGWPAAPRDRHVVPGAGGGSGTQADPFRGLQAAADAAQPGDVFHLAPGRYAPFVILAGGAPGAPVVFTGPADPTRDVDEGRWAIVDGAGTTRGVVQLGEFDRDTSWILLERLAIEDGYWGVDAQRTSHVTLRRCVVRDVGFGYYNRRDVGNESDQLVSDVVFSGRNTWPDPGVIPPERAVDLRGTRNVVRFCRIDHFGDGASIQPFTSAGIMGNDVHGNDISFIVDDPIELDYNVANARAWGNRVVNARMGISLAPIYGGPAYAFRNDFFNLEISAYKMNREPSGLVILHDTSAKLENGTSSPAGWQNTLLRNNVLLGTRYVFEEYGLVPGSVDDWDFDALGTPAVPFAKWNNVRYQDLGDLAANSGIEANAVSCSASDLVDAVLPPAYGDGVPPDAPDLRLRAGVPAVDSGATLANVNDPFVTDGRPDRGAHELGNDGVLVYGPRPRVILQLDFAGPLGSVDLGWLLRRIPDCIPGIDETSGAIGRTRIPAASATAAHELPVPGPLRLVDAGMPGGAALVPFEIEDASAAPCATGTLLFLARDAMRGADLIASWR